MSNKIVALLLGMCLIVGMASAQPSDKPEEIYHWRIKQEKLYDVYIPKDLAECFEQLNEKVSKASQAKFKAVDEMVAMQKLHFSLGRWIWHNWGLYGGSRLSVYMNKVGVRHPEDMADFIVIAYHRYLNKKPIEPKELVEFFEKRREKEKAEKAKKKDN